MALASLSNFYFPVYHLSILSVEDIKSEDKICFVTKRGKNVAVQQALILLQVSRLKHLMFLKLKSGLNLDLDFVMYITK